MIPGEFLLYETEDGKTRVECRFVEDTLWLTQALMEELFQKDVRTINEHLQNIYEEGELEPGATIRKFRIVRQEDSRQVNQSIQETSRRSCRSRIGEIRCPAPGTIGV
ncbi:MAG: hypothetical protein M0Q44_10730 [Methylobacter sp.]|jgi:hypothetical protein|nr:hypothetical protein [Methylobacter sp.]